MGKEMLNMYGYTQEPFGCFIAFYDTDDFTEGKMRFHYSYENRSGYMFVQPVGTPETAEELGRNAIEMFLKASKTVSKCVLINRQGAGIHFDKLDLVTISNLLDENGLQNLGVRVAVLVSPDNAKQFTSLETSLTIRAFSYKVFGDEQQAIAWLQGDS